MNTILKKQADLVYEHYQKLSYEYQEGLIGANSYYDQLSLINKNLNSISEQLEQIAQSLGVK